MKNVLPWLLILRLAEYLKVRLDQILYYKNMFSSLGS